MRLAVTGANGLIGAEAVALAAGDHEVLALGRGPCRLAPGPYRWQTVDLADGAATEAALLAFRPAAVLHAGALTDVDACERDPALAWRVNAGGTAAVARACARLGARLLALSTDYVFAGTAGPYAEEDAPAPRGAYAASKLAGEAAARSLAPDCAVGRVAVVYGGRPGARPTFAGQVLARLARGEPVRAFEDQACSSTLASAGAARCLELLLETRHRGLLHLSDEGVASRVEFARRLAVRFGLDPGLVVPARLADAAAQAGLLAWRPPRPGLRVERAAALLRHAPLGLDEALDRLWVERGGRAA